MEEGLIQGLVLGSKSNGADRAKTKADIIQQFSLKESDAEEYMIRYWDKAPKNN